MTRFIIILCLLLGSIAAPARAARQLVVDVPPEGGVFEIPVRPGYLTVLYFPADITSFVHGQSRAVKVQQRQHILTVEVDADAPPTSMSVECRQFRIGLLLRPAAADEEPVVQVQFRELAYQQKLQAEVAKKLEPLEEALNVERSALARRRAALDREVQRRARQQIARALRRRYVTRSVSAMARNDDHVVIRMTEVVWLGDDVFVRLSIQNRSARTFIIDEVKARVGDTLHPVSLEIPAPTRTGLGAVLRRTTAHGVLLLPDATTLLGEDVDIAFFDSRHGSTLRVRLPLRR